jgi:hypothetical protein
VLTVSADLSRLVDLCTGESVPLTLNTLADRLRGLNFTGGLVPLSILISIQ